MGLALFCVSRRTGREGEKNIYLASICRGAARACLTDETAYLVYRSGDCVVRPEGLEPPTPRSVVAIMPIETESDGV